jgi:hypothetical protein
MITQRPEGAKTQGKAKNTEYVSMIASHSSALFFWPDRLSQSDLVKVSQTSRTVTGPCVFGQGKAIAKIQHRGWPANRLI